MSDCITTTESDHTSALVRLGVDSIREEDPFTIQLR